MKTVQTSVIVAAYNQEKYVSRCIRSLLNQSIDQNQYEVILVNDGSTDGTKQAIDPFINDLVYLENKSNIGLSKSLNSAIKKARGQFIIRVDSDDWVHNKILEYLTIHLQMNHNINSIACDYNIVDEKQNVLKIANCKDVPIGCGIMFRLVDLVNSGLYDETITCFEDEELRIRYGYKYSTERLSIPLYNYQIHKDQISKKENLLAEAAKKIKEKHGENENLTKAMNFHKKK